jgi:hypothetical protein
VDPLAPKTTSFRRNAKLGRCSVYQTIRTPCSSYALEILRRISASDSLVSSRCCDRGNLIQRRRRQITAHETGWSGRSDAVGHCDGCRLVGRAALSGRCPIPRWVSPLSGTRRFWLLLPRFLWPTGRPLLRLTTTFAESAQQHVAEFSLNATDSPQSSFSSFIAVRKSKV